MAKIPQAQPGNGMRIRLTRLARTDGGFVFARPGKDYDVSHYVDTVRGRRYYFTADDVQEHFVMPPKAVEVGSNEKVLQSIKADAEEFTPEALEHAAQDIDCLRADTLFGIDGAGAGPEAEQLYLLALASLEQAHRQMKLAQYAQARALTGG